MRIFLTAVLLVLCVFPATADEFKAPLEKLIGGYIRPATDAFAAASAGLPEAVQRVCQSADEQTVAQFRSSYSDVVKAYAAIHFLRFGPLLEEDRVNRLAFMPDPRGITSRQIRKLSAASDKSVLSAETLKGKSVAVQGLTALELIAFDKQTKVTLGANAKAGDFTCGYALAISENIAEIAENIRADWADANGYSDVLLSAGPDNDRFHSDKEAMEEVFNILATGLTVARDQNILPALGSSEAKAKPRRIPFSRSANGVLYLSGELSGIEQAFASMELKTLVAPEHEWLFDTVGFEFKNANNLLQQLKAPLRLTFAENGTYGKLKVLAITLQSARELVTPEIAGALGLAGGFNALDGD